MSNPRIKSKAHKVGAGSSLPVAMGGTFILNVSSDAGDGELKLRMGDGDEVFFDAGTYYKLEPADEFQNFTLINSGAGTVTVVVAVGRGEAGTSSAAQITNTVTVNQTKPATIGEEDDVTVANGSATTILAADSTRRKAILVSDPANTVACRISGAPTATAGAKLQPGQPMEIEGTDDIKGWGMGGDCVISITVVKD